MTHTVLIDVAIGLAFLYFLLSAFTMAVNEMLAKWLDTRAKDLRDTISSLLAPDSGKSDLLTKLYEQPIIASFAVARRKTDSTTEPRVSYLPPKVFATALIRALCEGKQTFADVDNAIGALPDGKLKKLLVAAVADAGQDIEKLRNRMSEVFDGVMERLSGAYKRKQQLWSFIAGAVFAILANADTLMMVHRLQAEPALRDAAVASARQSATQEKCKGSADAVSCLEEEIAQTQLLGWDFTSRGTPRGFPSPSSSTWQWLSWFLLKVTGLFLTALAVSFGAPFWFDLLGKIPGVSIRGTGSPPQKEAKT